MRLFGHHPQVLRTGETPYHQSGDDEYDIKSYLLKMYRIWSQPENKEKLLQIRREKLIPIFMAKTANKGIKEVMDFVKAPDIKNIFEK